MARARGAAGSGGSRLRASVTAARTTVRDDRAMQVLVVAVVLGFVLRLAWIVYATRTPAGSHDPAFYEQLALHIARGDGYTRVGGEPTAYYPPGYPLFLAVPTWFALHGLVGGDTAMAGSLLNLILGTATIAFVGVLGRRLVGPRTGAVAALLVAFTPSLIIYTSVLLTETTFNAVFVLALMLVMWKPWRTGDEPTPPGLERLAVVGFLLGIAVLIRPTIAPAVLALLVALWVACRDLRAWLVRAGSLLVAAALVLVPWTIRNATQLDALVPISTNTGDNLCIGNHPGAPGSFAMPDYCFSGLPAPDPPASEVEQNRLLTRRALDWIKAHPLEQPRLVAWRTYFTFLNDHEAVRAVTSYDDDPWLSARRVEVLNFVSDAGFFGLLALGVLGLAAFRARSDPRRLALVLVILGIVVAPWPFFGEPRFHVPLLPLLAIPAALPLVGLPALRARRED